MKLETKDLMIGNILDFNGMECVVKEIDEFGVVVTIEETGEEEWIDIFQFSAVPITREILLKLGWQPYNNDEDKETLTKDFNGKMDIDFYQNKLQVKSHYEGYHLYRPLFDVIYYHQLQNLINILG